MAETLGSLCDKLTVVKLKQWHSTDDARLESLSRQEEQLVDEIDEFLFAAAAGAIPAERITFAANKVFAGNAVEREEGTVGEVLSRLANANCALWHEQERVYDFEKVPAQEKDGVVKRLALLNLQRCECIDAIDRSLLVLVERRDRPAQAHVALAVGAAGEED